MDPSEGSEPVEMRSERDPADPPTDSVVEIVCVSPSSPASSSGLSLGKVVPRKKQKTNIKGRSVVPCSFCCVTFSNNTNLNKHIRAFHPGFVKCDICDQSVLTDVEQHLKQAHSLTLKHSKLIFNNEIDFQLWKVEEEKRTGSQYVSTSGTKKTPACVAKRYFICRRSGKFQSHSKLPPQSQKKPRGSIRCGVKCPARITLTVDHSGSYLVDYQEVHYGHERDTQGNQVVGRSQIKRLQSRHTQRLDSKSQSVAQQRQQPADRNSSEDPLKNSVSAKTPTPEAAIQPAVKLHYLESLWDLRNSEQFRNLGERLHMYFDRKSAVVLVSEV
ncbi:hypothetical protein BIW11_11641 [Tropilaelaps mercedesae]|uniref:C2H2-type domain-containing protein n=1 Tax=Tropilaelaps mercedesae TaxID=418985 RepID=A0A1V9XA74_9ACAR|nr:hypothetical protein BIW11_11641 [Tropilaelaps mercedesae]